MSRGGGGGGGGGSLWEAQPWVFSNSDNSGGSEQKSGKKLPKSSSNSPTGPMVEKRRRSSGPASSKSPSSKGRGGGLNETKGGGGESDHEIHIWTERERRKKMRNMFSNLHALLPQLPSKADKSTIVDEAARYIKTLQQTLQNLQKQKLERTQGVSASSDEPSSVVTLQSQRPESREAFLADQGNNWTAAMNSPTVASILRFPHCFQTWSSPNVVLNVNGEDAHINICTAKKPGLLSTIFFVMEKHKLEVVSAHVSSDYFRSMYMVHAHASGVSGQFPETVMIEEIFKLAVGEMILWLSS